MFLAEDWMSLRPTEASSVRKRLSHECLEDTMLVLNPIGCKSRPVQHSSAYDLRALSSEATLCVIVVAVLLAGAALLLRKRR